MVWIVWLNLDKGLVLSRFKQSFSCQTPWEIPGQTWQDGSMLQLWGRWGVGLKGDSNRAETVPQLFSHFIQILLNTRYRRAIAASISVNCFSWLALFLLASHSFPSCQVGLLQEQGWKKLWTITWGLQHFDGTWEKQRKGNLELGFSNHSGKCPNL